MDKANAELFDVSGVQGTMYSGKVTIPPHSSVEIPLGDMMANALTNAISKNTENHKQSQEMTFRTDMLQFAKFDKQKKQQIREQINTPILMNIASMLPAEMIDAFKGLPSSASRTLRHDMEKLEERQLRGKSSIECLAPPKVISGRQIEHARREIALRCGKWLPFSFLIDVVEHWRTNVYVCQVITNEFHLPCCLALGVDREGKFAGKLRVRTGFFLRPDIWTIGWEAENRRIDPGDQSFTVKQLIAEHNRLMGILPMPMQVTDILGITMNDPVTNIAFN